MTEEQIKRLLSAAQDLVNNAEPLTVNGSGGEFREVDEDTFENLSAIVREIDK